LYRIVTLSSRGDLDVTLDLLARDKVLASAVVQLNLVPSHFAHRDHEEGSGRSLNLKAIANLTALRRLSINDHLFRHDDTEWDNFWGIIASNTLVPLQHIRYRRNFCPCQPQWYVGQCGDLGGLTLIDWRLELIGENS
jgi:hypothetical protein